MDYRKILGLLGFIIAFFYTVQFLIPFTFLQYVLSLLTIVFLLLAFPLLEKRVLMLVSIMLIAIVLMLRDSTFHPKLFVDGIRTNLPLVSIILMTPLLGILISAGNYIGALKIWARN